MLTCIDKKYVLDKTREFVKQTLCNDPTGHDWWHIVRVTKNAKYIARQEAANEFIVELSALLHDIGDLKFHNGDETMARRMISNWLYELGVEEEVVSEVIQIIENISYSKSLTNNYKPSDFSIETKIVYDADKLDAIGAIGIARVFSFGGHFNRQIHNPNISPKRAMTKSDYIKVDRSTSINFFYEMLLTLKEKMMTKTGRRLSIERHDFLETYLNAFHKEWGEVDG